VASFAIVNTAGAGMTPAIASAVREAAVCHGLAPDGADELREACETLVRRIAAGLEDTNSGGIEVTISRLPGRVVVRIDDPGVPYELADDAAGDPQAAIEAPSELLGFVRERVDHIDYTYRGRAGNRVELTKRITRRRRPKGDDPATSQPIDPDQPVEVRRMVEADAIPFVRNVYRSFGYTYSGDWAYRAEDVDQLLESGALTAWVAVAQDGAIVGHAAITRDPPGAKLGEGGAAVVDPAFRHHGIAVKLGMAALEWTQQEELFGLYALATTRHPHSQKAVLDLGGRELGLLLDYIPGSTTYHEFDEGSDNRSPVMVMYLGLGPSPAHDVHAPPRHRDVLSRIYDACQLNGGFVEVDEDLEPSGHTRMGVSIQTDRDLAKLDITRVGADFAEAARSQLDQLERGGIVNAYVDLPLSLPETPYACDVLERLGLSFAGVFPRADDSGWRLRLQYLHPEKAINRDEVNVASDFGSDLRDYVLEPPTADRA
jgi:GNAT superfamily N-acetyltransferase/anti-sigma regulatory factor (Ser/Thr protein kinase)